MTEVIQFFKSVEVFIEPFLKNLDPSLFQNVIIGILIIFIPIAIVFLQEKDTDFIRRMAIKEEVINFNEIFMFSIISIFIFAIYNNFGFILRITLLIIVFILVYFLIKDFSKLLNFSSEKIFEYEKKYLEKLSIKKSKNDLVDAYQSLWQRQIILSNEEVFTGIFISHIDKAIKIKKYELASQLAKIYVKNISERDTYLLVGEILPNVLGWSEEIWKDQYNPNGLYFSGEFFQEIIKISLKDWIDSIQLFSVFKIHIAEIEKKLDEVNNKEKNYELYINGLFESFCKTFFSEIKSIPSNYDIWESSFPKEWKISSKNKEKIIPPVILREFLRWSQNRIFKNNEKTNNDECLTEVIRGIFPNIHASLFTSFLVLLFSAEVGDVLDKEPNFYLTGTIVSNIGFAGEAEEVKSERINNDTKKQEISQKEETIQIILKYFFPWPATYSIDKNDLTGEEFKSFTKEKKQLILKRVRKEKIEELKKEIESIKIDENCKDSKRKKAHRTELLELVVLLLTKVKESR